MAKCTNFSLNCRQRVYSCDILTVFSTVYVSNSSFDTKNPDILKYFLQVHTLDQPVNGLPSISAENFNTSHSEVIIDRANFQSGLYIGNITVILNATSMETVTDFTSFFVSKPVVEARICGGYRRQAGEIANRTSYKICEIISK